MHKLLAKMTGHICDGYWAGEKNGIPNVQLERKHYGTLTSEILDHIVEEGALKGIALATVNEIRDAMNEGIKFMVTIIFNIRSIFHDGPPIKNNQYARGAADVGEDTQCASFSLCMREILTSEMLDRIAEMKPFEGAALTTANRIRALMNGGVTICVDTSLDVEEEGTRCWKCNRWAPLREPVEV